MHTDVEQQVGSYLLMCVVTIRNRQSWVIPEIHQIRGEGNSFHFLHVYTTCYSLTKATKAMQLHTPLSYGQNTQKTITKIPSKYQYLDYVEKECKQIIKNSF